MLVLKIFRKRLGGLTWFQRWWGTFFCFVLDIFQVKLGRIGEDDQNLNTLRNFSLYKLRFLKSSSKESTNKGGGLRPLRKHLKQNRFFLRMYSLSVKKSSMSMIWNLLLATVLESTNITKQVWKKILDNKWLKEGIHLNRSN